MSVWRSSTWPTKASAWTSPAEGIASMTEVLGVERATFTVVDPKTGDAQGEPIDVHFNPVSLQFSITNQLDPQKSAKDKKQYVKESTGKLTMDLTFDTTDTGDNVREATKKVVSLPVLSLT